MNLGDESKWIKFVCDMELPPKDEEGKGDSPKRLLNSLYCWLNELSVPKDCFELMYRLGQWFFNFFVRLSSSNFCKCLIFRNFSYCIIKTNLHNEIIRYAETSHKATKLIFLFFYIIMVVYCD